MLFCLSLSQQNFRYQSWDIRSELWLQSVFATLTQPLSCVTVNGKDNNNLKLWNKFRYFSYVGACLRTCRYQKVIFIFFLRDTFFTVKKGKLLHFDNFKIFVKLIFIYETLFKTKYTHLVQWKLSSIPQKKGEKYIL